MIEQTFALGDLAKVALLVGLEILLSADNAIVLALLVKHLPEHQQQRALFYGLVGAFVFRAVAILAASLIIGLWWVQLLGAAYLIYLGVKHFVKHASPEKVIKAKQAGFWLTILYVELTDIAFAIDSVLVAVATEPRPEKLWVVYAGAMVGVIALRWAATIFLGLLHRFPVLEHVAYVLVAWAGVKLLMLGGHTLERWYNGHGSVRGFQASSGLPAWPSGVHIPEMPLALFWSGVALVVVWGLWSCVRSARSDSDRGDQPSTSTDGTV